MFNLNHSPHQRGPGSAATTAPWPRPQGVLASQTCAASWSPFMRAVAGVSVRPTVVLATAAAISGSPEGVDVSAAAAVRKLSLPPPPPPPPPPQKSLESPLVMGVIGAGCTWVYELFCGHELEFIKVAKQTSPNESYLALVRGITRHKGILGLLDGFFPWGSIQAVAKVRCAHAHAPAFGLFSIVLFVCASVCVRSRAGGVGPCVCACAPGKVLRRRHRSAA